MAIIKKSAPWVTYYKELNELFREDDDVFVIYDEDGNTINVYVNNEAKAGAIQYLLPTEKEFGNVILKIEVIPANGMKIRNVDETNILDIVCDAFRENDAVYMVTGVRSMFDLIYVIFRREVVQYFDDNLGDINGNCSTLYEVIARDVFRDVGVKYCTDCGKENRTWI